MENDIANLLSPESLELYIRIGVAYSLVATAIVFSVVTSRNGEPYTEAENQEQSDALRKQTQQSRSR